MGQQGDRPTTGIADTQTAVQVLQAVTQDLQSLHQGLIGQLSRDVAQLQAEKARLMGDIEKLQAYHQALQSRQLETLSQQQLAQQQLWAKQLAQVLANHLQALMVQRINQLASANPTVTRSGTTVSPAMHGSSDHAHRLLASLDSTFSSTFTTLQQELNSYQSSLSQQLNRMHSLEQQGEAILEALIQRLRDQLQTEATRSPSLVQPQMPPLPTLETSVPLSSDQGLDKRNGYSVSASPNGNGAQYQTAPPPKAAPIPLEFPAAPLPLPKPPLKKETSQFQLGLLLVMLSTVALSIHNVVVRIIGSHSTVLGLLPIGGFLKFGVGNSLLTLWLRMLVVLPLMIPVAMFLYPPVWCDIRKFLTAPDRRPLFNVVGSGFFLFLSQVCIYMAIDKIGAGPAVTILFMYPIITVPLAWFLFGDRPTPLRWIVMSVISLGVILTALPNMNFSKLGSGGVSMAIFSGIAFAFYLLFMQLGFKKLHPIPVSLVQFSTIFLLSSMILMQPFVDLGAHVDNPIGFAIGGVVLGALTLIGYLANNFGVRYMGAARASIIASSGPVMTALLAFLLIQNPLKAIQIFGILLVTGGVTALSFERMKAQPATKLSR